MLDWIIANRNWLFDGIGATFIAGLVAVIWRRLYRPSSSPPQVVVHFQERASTPVDAPREEPIRVERIASITAAEIEKVFDEAPPLQRTQIRERYVGLKIEWDTALRAADEEADGLVRLLLRPKGVHMFSLTCRVKFDDYRELGILPEDSLIRVYGTIEDADRYSVKLTDAELKYMEPKKAPKS